MPKLSRFQLTDRAAAFVVAVASIAIVVQLAALERRPPVRCPAGLALFAGRCCGAGQTFAERACRGPAQSCGANQLYFIEEDGRAGCALEEGTVRFTGGQLPLGAADWQVSAAMDSLEVAAFAIDRGEVTVQRWLACAAAGACEAQPADLELGLPVAGVSAARAEAFCRFAGGRLPTSAEWRFAASGREGRRFPWGSTGLVCRRASFGLLTGPCSREGMGPDLAGARPDGATPEGVLDLAGNLAEWTRDPDGRYRVRGGSFRSRVAAELITAAVEVPPPGAAHVGFRCAYAASGPLAAAPSR